VVENSRQSLREDDDDLENLFPAGIDSAGLLAAWVTTKGHRVYALGETGWRLQCQELQNASYKRFWSSAVGGSAVWVYTTAGVFRLDVDGHCHAYSDLAGLTVETIYASADRDSRAWAIAGRPGEDYNLWFLPENDKANLIEGTAMPRDNYLYDHVFPTARIDAPPPSALWVLREDEKRLYRVGADGNKSDDWNPPDGEVVGTLWAVGQTAWVLVGKGQKLYRFRPGTDDTGSGQPALALTSGDEQIVGVYPAGEESGDAWVVVAPPDKPDKTPENLHKTLYAVHPHKDPPEKLFEKELTWVVPAVGGKGVWAGTSEGKVYRVNNGPKPQPLRGGEAFFVNISEADVPKVVPVRDALWAAGKERGVYRFEDKGTVRTYLEQEQVVDVCGPSSDGRFVWAVPPDALGLLPVKVAADGGPELEPVHLVRINGTRANFFPAGRPDHGWIASISDAYTYGTYGPAAEGLPTVSVNGVPLSLSSGGGLTTR
jgi:hypothetical protein